MLACLVMSFWRFGSISIFSVFLQVEAIRLSFTMLSIMGDFLTLFFVVDGLGACVVALIVVSWAMCMILWIVVRSCVEFSTNFCLISYGVS